MRRYKDYIVWQKSIILVELIYKYTSLFPKSEQFGLSAQMRRSSVSIPSNIAEGAGRKSKREFNQFFSIAYGSAVELETQLIIAGKLGFVDQENQMKLQNIVTEVLKMLSKLLILSKD